MFCGLRRFPCALNKFVKKGQFSTLPPEYVRSKGKKSTSLVIAVVAVGGFIFITAAPMVTAEVLPREWYLSIQEFIGGENFYKLAEPQGVITQKVFLDIKIKREKTPERIIIGLYGNELPRAAENFKHLCIGDIIDKNTSQPRHYKGCKFQRIVPNFMMQTGDYVNNSGHNSPSIYYDGGRFEDESFVHKHIGLGELIHLCTHL